ncbi:MAG TPA: NAD-dependent epimerase/dehydratase family protein [Puia sp.]|nr:NAD-dependent epimerase/dehydratase family protein [Puia sp.]
MKIIVLGSEGFIGSHAVRHFRAAGHAVTAADIVLKQEKDYLLINPELPDFARIFTGAVYDLCINATGAANVQLSFSHPAMDYMLNVTNVYNILDSIRQYNPACRFINFSSAAVYGNPVSLPISESAALDPVSPYGYHKVYSEQVCREFFRLFGVATINLRVFSAYGEGLKKQLFWDMHRKISEARDAIELFGTGNETRDFIYISDIMHAIDCVVSHAPFDGTAINLASGKESSIREVTDLFVHALRSNVRIRFTGNNKIGDPLNWRADISLLSSYGFTTRYSLSEGINNYCHWLREKK